MTEKIISTRIDISYNEDNNKFYVNFAKVNRIPPIQDLYYVSRAEQGNPNLKAETAWSGELIINIETANY